MVFFFVEAAVCTQSNDMICVQRAKPATDDNKKRSKEVPIAQVVYKPPRRKDVTVVLPNGRREPVPCSEDDTIRDVVRRACVAEGLPAPPPQAQATAAAGGPVALVDGRQVRPDAPLSSVVGDKDDTPVVLQWPAGAAVAEQPKANPPSRVFVELPGKRTIVCAMQR